MDNPNVVSRDATLKWMEQGHLVSSSSVYGSRFQHHHEVPVDAVISWIDAHGVKDVFGLVNEIDPTACNWVIARQYPNSVKVPEKDYTRYLWGVTPLELKGFLERGYVEVRTETAIEND